MAWKRPGLRRSNEEGRLRVHVIANKRADTMRREQVYDFELELKESLVPQLCAFDEQSLLEVIEFYGRSLALGGTIPLSGRPRFPRLSNMDVMEALGVKE